MMVSYSMGVNRPRVGQHQEPRHLLRPARREGRTPRRLRRL